MVILLMSVLSLILDGTNHDTLDKIPLKQGVYHNNW